jgi:ATP-dependent RNA helicase DeaD
VFKALSDALAERNYDTLTAVQRAVTAPELREADLLVSAQTGSGKTVGFGLAVAPTLLGEAESLDQAREPLCLVVAPTRELALQVMRELGWLYAGAGARVVSCVGGMDMRDERRALERGAHIVVGTPGRLRDHIQRGSLDLSCVRAVVLDEADEMLDLGFREDLEFMLGQAPQDRRTLMFSATVPPAIAKLAKQFQRDAVRLTTLSDSSQHADIAYQALRVAPIDAENAIINVLRYHDARNAIVFANTRSMVNRLTARLSNRGFAVVALSGELSQTERTHALQAMRDGRARVCVATDVAARGIDLPNLELVVHAELPSNTDGLLHRSGRTGRAGRKGTSVLIVPPKIGRKAERLLNMAKVQAEWTVAPSADEILRRDEERLLADPVWDEAATEDEAAFAAKLLALHAPETIAAAYLRLYRARQSAPEDLASPDARPAPKARPSFDGSTWFALSVGRDDRAEARWLLPLVCRAGDLDKQAIGAIRIQQAETFVEISATSVPGFLAAIGGKSELEKGIAIRQLDGPPDLSSPAPARARSASPSPARQGSATAEPETSTETPKREGAAAPDGPPPPRRKPRRDREAEAAEPKPHERTSPTGDRSKPGGKRTKEWVGKARVSNPDRTDAGKPGGNRKRGKFAAGSDGPGASTRPGPPAKAGARMSGKPAGRPAKPRSGSDGPGSTRRGKR